MKPDLAVPPPPQSASPSPSPWRAPLLRLAAAWVGLVAVFAADWAAMVSQWWDSSTYNHILLVPVIIAWLVHLRLPQLRRLKPVAWWPGLLLAAAALVGWLLGAFAGADIVRQFGAVGLLAACVPLLLGPHVTAGLAFPLCYMVFLVPFGDGIVPALQMITAAITIALVRASAIPAAIDGVFIDTPAGLFEVAEACSGVKFLIAMIAFGTLVAHVCFTSRARRTVFLAACIVVPVLANGVRAWGTIYVAQFMGAEYAGGFDHIVYGWLFFAVVIAVILGLSWRFFDRPVDDAVIDSDAIAASPLLRALAAWRIAPALALALLATGVVGVQAWAAAAANLRAAMPRQIVLPEVPGWQRVRYDPPVLWEPQAMGSDHRLLGRYADAAGRHVDVFVALYAHQGEGVEAGGFGQGAMPGGGAWAWLSSAPSLAGGKGERLLAVGSVQRLALTWYRSGSMFGGSNTRLRLAAMTDRLLLRERPTVMLILSAEEDARHPAAASIAEFARAVGPLDRWVDRIAAGR